jgi:hypothetical protein
MIFVTGMLSGVLAETAGDAVLRLVPSAAYLPEPGSTASRVRAPLTDVLGSAFFAGGTREGAFIGPFPVAIVGACLGLGIRDRLCRDDEWNGRLLSVIRESILLDECTRETEAVSLTDSANRAHCQCTLCARDASELMLVARKWVGFFVFETRCLLYLGRT